MVNTSTYGFYFYSILAYNYACDTSSLIENYPSMTDSLIQGAAVIDLSHVQEHVSSFYTLYFSSAIGETVHFSTVHLCTYT